MADIKNNEFQEIKLRIKKYLELENVSILAGAGTSFHLGAPIIRKVLELEGLKTICQTSIKTYFGEDGDPSYEDLFNCLQADKFLKEKKKENADDINNVMVEMQKWLFKNCDTHKTTIREQYSDDSNLQKNPYYYHEAFIKKLLKRPII